MSRPLDIAVITDEVSRDLGEALAVSRRWGLTRFELREGSRARFPGFTRDEIRLVEDALREGAQVTAVSPGLHKGHVADEARIRSELDDVLPRAIELAMRFESPLLIIFGFEREEGEPTGYRTRAMRAFEQVTETAAAAGMTVAVENEPNFWIDRPEETAALFEEIGHPALKANWDPANLHWGGQRPTYEGFEVLRPHLANVHVKDFHPADPQAPWRPLGQGQTPWPEILHWIVEETDLPHVTLETHCVPLLESSRQSLDALRQRLADVAEVPS